ncbi:MAG: DNA polymerase I [Gammaproteobacteria bacterium]|nr:DNA polymerase I [Gammaproteobacteria bacterium]
MSKSATEQQRPPIILVDGSSYLYRAYHALPPLMNSAGQPTGAIRGVVSMLRKLISDYQPEELVVIFDAKGKTFRNDLYPEYKANRPPMPDDLRDQIAPLHDVIKTMGLPLLAIKGVEADDVIGTLAAEATSLGRRVVISTGDKDMAQLVSEHVSLVNTMNKADTPRGYAEMDREGVIEKFGLPPERIIDYLTLMGDKVDNIPGVPKVGPKTAVKWLLAYGTLEGVIENADKIKGKVGENLRDALEQLPLSHELATIKLDVELEKGVTEYPMQTVDNKALHKLFSELEFKSWIKELDKASRTDSASSKGGAEANAEQKEPLATDYEQVMDKASFSQWLKRLEDAELFAFDTETTSLNYMEAELVGVSFATEAGKAAYVPLAHDYEGAPQQLDRDWVLSELKPLLESESHFKVGQNLKYDQSILARYDIVLNGIQFDTMLESYVLDSTATRHDMDSLAEKYLDHQTIHFEDVAGKGVKQITFNQVPLEVASPYAAEDADITLRLHQTLWPQLLEEPELVKVFEEIERPLLSVLSKIERTGCLIDSEMLFAQSHELGEQIAALEQKAHDLAGQPFNLGSPKQLGEILYQKLEIPVIKKTPKGQPSTAEPVLQELAYNYELPSVILEYRSLSKLKSTYTDKLPGQVDGASGRVHTSYHQAVAATGRLSSSDPNLQNIPVRTPEGRRIRQAFIAPKGYKLLAADYSQIELRIMAHLSGDKGLLDAFSQGLDIHKATAAEVFSVSLDEVSDNQRRSAKAINFGLIYGMSAFGLAKQLDIPRHEAQAYIDRYFARYPGVQDYMENTRTLAAQQGYVETIFGRRLYLPEINARNAMRRQAAERAAINAPMQGTAADIIKRAMLAVDAYLVSSNVDARVIMQVHDELVLEVAEESLEAVQGEIITCMESAAELAIALQVDVGTGDNWDEAH